MSCSAKIKEIFSSIQGEGIYIGVKQLFIRFCGCNLSCSYCDTDFDIQNSKTYTIDELTEIVKQNSDCHSVSLTGGEPLLNADYLEEFLPKCTLPVYLETNATLAEELDKIIDYVDYIAADIKIPSCCGGIPHWIEHDKFFSIASQKILFAKIVFNSDITDDEIKKSTELAKKYNIELVLQPMCNSNSIAIDTNTIESVFDKYLINYKKVRLIPQVHKMLNIR